MTVELSDVSTLVSVLREHAEALKRNTIAIERLIASKHRAAPERELKLEVQDVATKDMAWAATVDKMHAAFKAVTGKVYAQGVSDSAALRALVDGGATDAELVERWERGLRAEGYRSCRTFAELRSKWNGLIEMPSRIKQSSIEDRPSRRM